MHHKKHMQDDEEPLIPGPQVPEMTKAVDDVQEWKPDKAPESDTARNARGFGLAMGIFATLMTYGYVQERIMTSNWDGMHGHEISSLFLVMCNRVCSMMVAVSNAFSLLPPCATPMHVPTFLSGREHQLRRLVPLPTQAPLDLHWHGSPSPESRGLPRRAHPNCCHAARICACLPILDQPSQQPYTLCPMPGPGGCVLIGLTGALLARSLNRSDEPSAISAFVPGCCHFPIPPRLPPLVQIEGAANTPL